MTDWNLFELTVRNDIQVGLKKKYNDTYKSSKNLLSGSEWYCQQAFRALNQAAGKDEILLELVKLIKLIASWLKEIKTCAEEVQQFSDSLL